MFSKDSEHNYKEEIPFEEDGFTTGSIVLPGLELPLSLSKKHYFKFDGIVPDMWEYLKSLPTDMKFYLQKYIGDPRIRSGFNMGFKWFDYTGMLMAVTDISPRANLSNISHESAEIAYQLGYRNELETRLKQIGLKKEISGLDNHEVGVIAGILLPRSKGIEVVDLYNDQDPYTYRSILRRGYI